MKERINGIKEDSGAVGLMNRILFFLILWQFVKCNLMQNRILACRPVAINKAQQVAQLPNTTTLPTSLPTLLPFMKTVKKRSARNERIQQLKAAIKLKLAELDEDAIFEFYQMTRWTKVNLNHVGLKSIDGLRRLLSENDCVESVNLVGNPLNALQFYNLIELCYNRKVPLRLFLDEIDFDIHEIIYILSTILISMQSVNLSAIYMRNLGFKKQSEPVQMILKAMAAELKDKKNLQFIFDASVEDDNLSLWRSLLQQVPIMSWQEFNNVSESRSEKLHGRYSSKVSSYKSWFASSKELLTVKLKKLANCNLKAVSRELKLNDFIAQMAHPNLRPIKFAFIIKDQLAFISSNFKWSLEQFIAANREDVLNEREIIVDYECIQVPLKEKHIQFVAKQVLTALNFLHEKGFIHGNVRSENILLAEELKDFSSAALTDFSECMQSPAKPSETVRYSQWKAPEAFNPHSSLTTASDIWSLGMVMLEMIDQFSIFNMISLPRLYRHPHLYAQFKITDRLAIKRAMCNNISDLLFDFISKCLIYDAQDRLSASQLLGHSFLKEINN